MSTKDISRFLFQPRKHYVGMRMQQGRVTLDSDHNEGAWHDDEDQRQTLLELIGPQGSPDGGFFIGYTTGTGPGGTPQPITLGVNPGTTAVEFNDDGTDVQVPNYFVMPGTMYVGGLRVELEEPEHIAFQSDYLQNSPILGDIPSDLSSSATVAHHFFFLNVWEQCVTAVEDEEFLERALGGPDTSVRVRRMRRVEFLLAEEGEDCVTALERALSEQTNGLGEFVRETGELRSPGRLWIDFATGDAEDTCAPCHPDPTGRYLGAENQAIRIMLVDEGHFVWAYDNAAPLYRVTIAGVSDNPGVGNDPRVTMLTLPKDEEHWPLRDRVVEILPWSAILENGEKVAEERGVFCRVSRGFIATGDDAGTFLVDPSDTATMAELNDLIHAWDNDHPRLADLDAGSEPRHFYVRFWHQVGPGTPVEIPTTSTSPLGSTGLVPRFLAPGLPGDYWIAALRPETPDRTVPFDLHGNTAGVPPHGPRHFYSPLAMIHSANNVVTGVEDCRRHIVPVTDTGCCTFIVGDGVHSFGQYTSIQAAVNALPPQGGKVCVRPGTYVERVSIGGRTNVTIEGCSTDTVVVLPTGLTGAVFSFSGSHGCVIRSLEIRTTSQAIGFGGSHDGGVFDVRMVELSAGTPSNANLLNIAGSDRATVRNVSMQLLTGSGISTGGGVGFLFENVTIIDGGEPVSGNPLIFTGGGEDMTFVDCRMVAKGRSALFAGGPTRMRMERVTVQCTNAGSARAEAAIQIFGANHVDIVDCRFDCQTFSEHAVLTLSSGAGITVRNCSITASSDFWGGIHLFAGTNFRILDNRIIGGAGHGITLGSVVWTPQGGGTSRALEPAGRGQLVPGQGVTGDLVSGFVDGTTLFLASVPSQTFLDNVVIAGNHIEQMGTNGISALTVAGLTPGPNQFVSCRNLVIERNQIHDCLKGPIFRAMTSRDDVIPIGGSIEGSRDNHGIELDYLPLGGIVLGVVREHARICGNVIQDNGRAVNVVGPGEAVPLALPAYSGILVLLAEQLVISGNRIANNGERFGDHISFFDPGVRAGIAVLYATNFVPANVSSISDAFPATLPDNPSFGDEPSQFAVRIHDNQVVHPEGRALFAVASGGMSVDGNHLASQGNHPSDSPPDRDALGDAVYLHNLGKPWEALDTDMTHFESTASAKPSRTESYSLQAIWDEATQTRPVFFTGFGGHLLFNNNHVVYDWSIQLLFEEEPASFFPVAVISLDHVGMSGNAFALRIQKEVATSPSVAVDQKGDAERRAGLLVGNVLALGATVNVVGNRSAEGAEEIEISQAEPFTPSGDSTGFEVLASVSMVTVGLLMNTTVYNQGTRCILGFQGREEDDARFLRTDGNLALLSPQPEGCEKWRVPFQDVVDDLRELVWDRRTES